MNKIIDALKLAEEALVYHTQQTRPIQKTDEALAAIREALAEPVKQGPVVFKFPREPKPENAMGWTVDYGLIRDIAEAIGDQEFHPGYEGIELTLIALERIYAAPVSAEAIRAEALEEAAKVCEKAMIQMNYSEAPYKQCAAAIRARGEK